jgi:ADP-heptose:LPS heptosyltransferase
MKTVFMWTPGASDNPLYPGDDEVAEPVLAAMSQNIVPFRGPLKEAIALVWHARTSLFPDSGLMHFAAASPGGVLGFFAETDVSPAPSQWGPIGPKARWLDAEKSVSELDSERVLGLVAELVGT